MKRPLKWQLRVLAFRLGLWNQLERYRLKRVFRSRRPHEPDFLFFRNFQDKNGLFADLGANIGQSAVSFGSLCPKFDIVSFEPNPVLAPELSFAGTLLGPRFRFEIFGLGEQDHEMRLFIPWVDGVPLTQEASFRPETFLDDPVALERISRFTGTSSWEIRDVPFQVRRFDNLGLRPDIVKIDVQGAELPALRGMETTLREFHPLLLLENSPQEPEISGWLSARDYSRFCYSAERNRLEPATPERVRNTLNSFYVHSASVRVFLESRLATKD